MVAGTSQRKRSGPSARSILSRTSSGAGQIATTAQRPGSRPAAWMAANPPMLDPRRATCGA